MRMNLLLIAHLFYFVTAVNAVAEETLEQRHERVYSPIRSSRGRVSLEWTIDASDAILQVHPASVVTNSKTTPFPKRQDVPPVRVVHHAGDKFMMVTTPSSATAERGAPCTGGRQCGGGLSHRL